MIEAKLQEAAFLKRLLDALKELITDANFMCYEEAITLQGTDSSHVALVYVMLAASAFKKYRCDRTMPLGVKLHSLSKLLKFAKDDDVCTLKATDDANVLNLTYEAKNSDRIAEYDMKLTDIDSDTLGIPDMEYDARVTMPASEFSRLVRDFSELGESVRIELSKEGVRFTSDGEAAIGSVLFKQSSSSNGQINASTEESDVEDLEVDGTEEGDDQEGGSKEEAAQDGNEESIEKPRSSSGDDDPPAHTVLLEMFQPVTMTFNLKYLVNFSKGSSLADKVQLMMNKDVPLLVSYQFGHGHIRYYLAPVYEQ